MNLIFEPFSEGCPSSPILVFNSAIDSRSRILVRTQTLLRSTRARKIICALAMGRRTSIRDSSFPSQTITMGTFSAPGPRSTPTRFASNPGMLTLILSLVPSQEDTAQMLQCPITGSGLLTVTSRQYSANIFLLMVLERPSSANPKTKASTRPRCDLELCEATVNQL